MNRQQLILMFNQISLTNGQSLTIVPLTNNDSNAAYVDTGTVVNGKVVIANVWKVIYKVDVTLGGFKTDVDLNAETPSLTYNLEEMA